MLQEPRGWLPLRKHAWHRGRRQHLPGAQVHRTPAIGTHGVPAVKDADPRLPPVLPPGLAPALQHLWTHGHSS